MEDDIASLRAKYESFVQASEGKDGVIGILRSEVDKHEYDVANLREEVEIARRSTWHQCQEEGRREGISWASQKVIRRDTGPL